MVPKKSKSHEDIDLASMNLEHLQLSRTSHSDPEVKNKDIFLLGTPVTAEAWAKAEFKSGDGTFKMTPKLGKSVQSVIPYLMFFIFADFCVNGFVWGHLYSLPFWAPS
jgi:hypothetical protein